MFLMISNRNIQLILINVCESLYRREKLRYFFTLKWCRCRRRKDHPKSSNSMQLNCCNSVSADSQVEEEKSLTRTLVRDNKMCDYAIIVANLCKAYDDSNVVRGIDFAVKQGNFGLDIKIKFQLIGNFSLQKQQQQQVNALVYWESMVQEKRQHLKC